MAYTIHITKKEDWTDKEPQITEAEFDKLLTTGILEPVDDASMSAWGAKKEDVFFALQGGDIISNPRKEKDIEKIKDVASVLHAKVQGDDGEFY